MKQIEIVMFAGALLAAGGCSKSKPSESGGTTGIAGSAAGTPAPSGSAAAPEPVKQATPPPPAAGGADEVRPPVAADLAEYTKDLKGDGKLTATIDTSLGAFHCELYGDKTPVTVANFVGLALGKKAWTDPRTGNTVKGKPYFDGLIFHRVIPGFMIQGGDPLGRGMGGPGYTFDDEIVQDLRMKPGVLAMANAGPGTNGSQFFIVEGQPNHLNGHHTIFGQCKEVELVTKITGVDRDPEDRPLTPVTINKVLISK